ncbi:hypothetical protein [Butyricimonas paravirosa]
MDPFVVDIPIGFELQSDYQSGAYTYNVTFMNYSGTDYEYSIYTTGEIERKGVFKVNSQTMMVFERVNII